MKKTVATILLALILVFTMQGNTAWAVYGPLRQQLNSYEQTTKQLSSGVRFVLTVGAGMLIGVGIKKYRKSKNSDNDKQ